MAINGLQLYRTKWHSGLTQQNHLSSAYLTEPEVMSTLVTRIFGMQGSNPIQYLTSGMGRSREIGNREYDWHLQGDDEKAVAISGNFAEYGANRTNFRVKFKEKWFASQEVLVLDDRDYRVRVMEDPYFDGSEWIYTLRQVGTATGAIPAALIEAGKEMSKEYTTVPEFSTGGNTTFSAPFKMRNHLSTLRKSYTVTRSAATDALVIQLADPNNPGKKSTVWTRYAEWEAMAQWYREIERSYWYSTFSADSNGVTDMLGNNGLPVYEGAGIREQIAPANIRNYTKLSENIIRDFLIDLSYNVMPESSREFVAFTGEYGFAEFDKAMKTAASNWTLVDSKFVTGSGQNLALGGQFKTYMGLNGTKITLKHLPLYDNTVINRKLHAETGRPLESYRFTFLDFGMAGGESNIQSVHKKSSKDIMWHTAGSVDPFGNTSKSVNTMRSDNLDGYSVHMLSECGIMIKNPMACGELICTNAAAN
tara:strand:+ start:3613 stop:5046 length:1434 start_codon:yes stop_codon:yes gene_type:complete